MTVTVNHSVTAQLSSTPTLGDLKELVAAAESAGMGSTAKLTVQHYAGDQREPSYTTLTVRQK